MRKYGLKIKVVERVGQTIKKMLQRSDPFQRNICQRRDCIICTKGFNINCRERGCVYQFCCLECEQERKYRGQTGRSIYHRTGEHMKNWDKDLHFCPLKRHSDLFHGGNLFEFEIEILSRCYGKPSRRMITEAVLIEELDEEETMNSRKEWTYTRLDKV